jgi:hypothetical protein
LIVFPNFVVGIILSLLLPHHKFPMLLAIGGSFNITVWLSILFMGLPLMCSDQVLNFFKVIFLMARDIHKLMCVGLYARSFASLLFILSSIKNNIENVTQKFL